MFRSSLSLFCKKYLGLNYFFYKSFILDEILTFDKYLWIGLKFKNFNELEFGIFYIVWLLFILSLYIYYLISSNFYIFSKSVSKLDFVLTLSNY